MCDYGRAATKVRRCPPEGVAGPSKLRGCPRESIADHVTEGFPPLAKSTQIKTIVYILEIIIFCKSSFKKVKLNWVKFYLNSVIVVKTLQLETTTTKHNQIYRLFIWPYVTKPET